MFYQPVDCKLTQEQVDHWVTMLKIYFGISDWIIRTKVCHTMGGNNLGLCNATASIKEANIRILSYDAFKENYAPDEYDMLQTLVHELLHVKMHLIDCNTDNKTVNMYAEQLVNDMASITTELLRRSLEGLDDTEQDTKDDYEETGEEEACAKEHHRQETEEDRRVAIFEDAVNFTEG